MKTFLIESKIYTEKSYPRALFIKTKIDANSDQEALDIFNKNFIDTLQGFVGSETSAKEMK